MDGTDELRPPPTPPPGVVGTGAGARRRPGRAVVAVVIVALLGSLGVGLVWAATIEPLSPGGGVHGAWGDQVELTIVPADRTAFPDGRAEYVHYVATYVADERITLRFAVTNTSPVPIRIVEVFPDHEDRCGWVPDDVYVAAAPGADLVRFTPTTLWPSGNLEVAVTGLLRCTIGPVPSRESMSGYDTVPIGYRGGGIVPRTSRLDPGFRFVWTPTPADEVLDTYWTGRERHDAWTMPAIALADVLRMERPDDWSSHADPVPDIDVGSVDGQAITPTTDAG